MDEKREQSQIVHYYNTEPTALPDNPEYVEVECCYLFDWDAFEDHHWKELEEIYSRLPGYLGKGPAWFGDDEENEPFLWASVEMVRLLQVYGVLRLEDWQKWDADFQAAAAHLPKLSPPPPPESLWSRFKRMC